MSSHPFFLRVFFVLVMSVAFVMITYTLGKGKIIRHIDVRYVATWRETATNQKPVGLDAAAMSRPIQPRVGNDVFNASQYAELAKVIAELKSVGVHDCALLLPEEPKYGDDSDDIPSAATTRKTEVRVVAYKARQYAQLSKVTEELEWLCENDCPEQTAQQLLCLKRALQTVGKRTFPFAYKDGRSVESWANSYTGRGIVVPIGQNDVRYAAFLVNHLRLLGCTLPIEMYVVGDTDVRADDRERLSSLGVRIQNLTASLDLSVVGTDRFPTKALALFASSFREVLLLDADVVFMRNPELLFEDEGYKSTGTLFYKDTLVRVDNPETRNWLLDNMPLPLIEHAMSTEIFTKLAQYQQNAAIVLVDKGARSNLCGVLATCRLAMKDVRGLVYSSLLYGDKEMYWLGFEIAQTDYAFAKYKPGAIGVSETESSRAIVCGNNLFFDSTDHRPFAWTSGVVLERQKRDTKLLKFEVIALNSLFTRPNGVHCSDLANGGLDVLTDGEKETIESLLRMWAGTTGYADW